MEEKKKRRGYATQEGQNEATKRYLQTEKGKEARKRTVAKSQTKKFIREIASYEELRELEEMIKEIKGEKYMKNTIKEVIAANGMAYVLMEATCEAKSFKEIESFEIFNDTYPTIQGVFSSEEEARKAYVLDARRLGKTVRANYARVIWVCADDLEDEDYSPCAIDDGSEVLGLEELKGMF